MIAVDSNVLLRYLLDDDPRQSRRAADLFVNGETILLTDVVLVETVWTLKGKKYRIGKPGLIRVLNALFEEPAVCFEDATAVWRALQDYRKCKPVGAPGKRREADFPDALIVNKARQHGHRLQKEVSAVYTFDEAARTLEGTRAP